VLDLLGGNSQTKVIFFNCFGGMHDMGKISAVLIDAVKKSFTKGKPIVVRMKGLSAPQAIKSLQQFNNEQSQD
jgi:succinyl-CoA synthetase beta subunit